MTYFNDLMEQDIFKFKYSDDLFRVLWIFADTVVFEDLGRNKTVFFPASVDFIEVDILYSCY